MAGRQIRTRLELDARRESLLLAGVALLAEVSPDEISVSDVSKRAGISRGLLYHYFEDKESFVAAVVERVSDDLGRLLSGEALGASDDPLAASVDAFIDFAEAHAAGFRALVTGAVRNPQVAALIDRTRERDLNCFVEAVALRAPDPERARTSPVLRAALHAHMHFMEGAVARWLGRREISRDQLRALLIHALAGAVGAAVAVDTQEAQA